jgi:hypothetical protein
LLLVTKTLAYYTIGIKYQGKKIYSTSPFKYRHQLNNKPFNKIKFCTSCSYFMMHFCIQTKCVPEYIRICIKIVYIYIYMHLYKFVDWLLKPHTIGMDSQIKMNICLITLQVGSRPFVRTNFVLTTSVVATFVINTFEWTI